MLDVFDTIYRLWTQEGLSRFAIKDRREFTDLLLQQAAQSDPPRSQDDGKDISQGTILRINWHNGLWFGFIKRGFEYENVYFDSRGYRGETRELIPNRRVRFEGCTGRARILCKECGSCGVGLTVNL